MTKPRSAHTANADLLDQIVLETPQPIFLFDSRGRIAFLNDRASQLAGLTREQLTAKPFGDLFRVPAGSSPTFLGNMASLASREVQASIGHLDETLSRIVIKSRVITDDAGDSYLLCFGSLLSDGDVQRRQRILAQIFSEIISVKPLAEVLHSVVQLLVEVAEVDHATLTLLDEAGKNFRFIDEYPPGANPTLIDTLIPIQGHPIQEAIVRDKKAVIATDLASHPILTESTRVAELTEQLGNKSVVILPMVYKDRVIGTIGVDSQSSPKAFYPDEIEMFQTIANHAALAIENARNLESAQNLQKLYSEAYSAFSLEGVANKILADVREIVPCRKASIQLIVNNRRVLLGGYGFDKDKASPRLLGRVAHDALVKKIIDAKEIEIIADTRDVDIWKPQPETADVLSWLGIPLVFGNEPIALITMDHDEPGFYGRLTETKRNDLEQFASTAGIEINEAYRFDAAQHQIQAFALVNRVAEIVGTTLKEADLLEAITREIQRSLRCNQCKVLLLARECDEPSLVTRGCWPPASDAEAVRVALPIVLPRPVSPIIEAFVTGERVVVHDFVEPEQATQFAVTAECPPSTQSMTAVPIKIADQTIGVLVASHTKINWCNPSDELLLATVARHTGVAIERDRGLELVQRVGRDILRAKDVEEVLKEIVTGAIELTHTDSGVIYLVNEQGTAIIQRFCPEGSEHPHPRLAKEDGITRTVIDNKAMLEIEDISTDSRVNPVLRDSFKSLFAVPLLLERRVVGVLYLNGRNTRRLTDTERVFVSTLADQAAIVIQRMALDEQVRNSEALYHSLVDHIPQSVFRKDERSRFTSANKAFCDSLAKSWDDVRGRTDFDFYSEEIAASFVGDDQAVMRDRAQLEKEERHQTKWMDEPIWVRVIKRPVLDAKGNVTGVQGIFWDVTRERELKELQERYRSLVEQSPDSIVLHKGGRIALANPAAIRLFGVVSEDDLKGRSILEFVHSVDLPVARERLDRLSSLEAGEQMVEMRIHRGSEAIDVAVYGRRLPGDSGIQIVFHDLTRVNTLLGEMHHRVRGALNVVSGFLYSQERHASDVDVPDIFRGLRRRIEAMALVHTMLESLRAQRNIPLEPYLEQLTSAVCECYPTEGVDCEVSASGLSLNESRTLACGLIVTELVSNSLLHGFGERRTGRIQVRLTERRGHYTLLVADNGSGFVVKSAKQSMGLTLVKRLVADDLKGTLTTAPRKGGGVAVRIEFDVPRQVRRRRDD